MIQGDPRVGTAANLSLAYRVQMAVVAHIRHCYTDYDTILQNLKRSYREGRTRGLPREQARAFVARDILNKLIEWRGDDENGGKIMEHALQEVIVIDDYDSDGDLDDEEEGEDGFELISAPGSAQRGGGLRTTAVNPAVEGVSDEEAPPGFDIIPYIPRKNEIDRRSRYQAPVVDQYRGSGGLPAAVVPQPSPYNNRGRSANPGFPEKPAPIYLVDSPRRGEHRILRERALPQDHVLPSIESPARSTVSYGRRLVPVSAADPRMDRNFSTTARLPPRHVLYPYPRFAEEMPYGRAYECLSRRDDYPGFDVGAVDVPSTPTKYQRVVSRQPLPGFAVMHHPDPLPRQVYVPVERTRHHGPYPYFPIYPNAAAGSSFSDRFSRYASSPFHRYDVVEPRAANTASFARPTTYVEPMPVARYYTPYMRVVEDPRRREDIMILN